MRQVFQQLQIDQLIDIEELSNMYVTLKRRRFPWPSAAEAGEAHRPGSTAESKSKKESGAWRDDDNTV
jgi:hypothetical protein